MSNLSDPSMKLEPFLLMSKSAKGAAAAKLIQDVTTAPGVLVFGELMEVPSIKEVIFLDLIEFRRSYFWLACIKSSTRSIISTITIVLLYDIREL